MTTQRQKNAVNFCEAWLDIRFNGNIDNFDQVSKFLSLYLDNAKTTFNEALSSYLSYIADKDWI